MNWLKNLLEEFYSLFPRREIGKSALILSLFVLFLIFMPPLFTSAKSFHADNYYQLTSGIIAGIITLFALVWQFANERERSQEELRIERDKSLAEQERVHEENRIKSRGYFEIYYHKGVLSNTDVANLANKRKVYTDINTDKYHGFAFIARYHGADCVYDCFVRITGSELVNAPPKSEIASIGLVVPNQIFFIPISVARVTTSDPISFTVLYRTTMGETLIRRISFSKGINDIDGREVLFAKQSDVPITLENMSSILDDEGYQKVFDSQCKLFLYDEI